MKGLLCGGWDLVFEIGQDQSLGDYETDRCSRRGFKIHVDETTSWKLLQMRSFEHNVILVSV